jgi:hypothetical protein
MILLDYIKPLELTTDGRRMTQTFCPADSAEQK